MEIPLSPFLTKIILYLNPFNRLKVMCLGYDDDFELFTELIWRDDKEINFYDQKSYPKFQLWYV